MVALRGANAKNICDKVFMSLRLAGTDKCKYYHML